MRRSLNILLFLSTIGSLFHATSAQEKLTNIDFLGNGYDVIIGNPQNDLYDHGFRQSVFNLTYQDRKQSSDGKWLLPDSVEARQTTSCSYQCQVHEITGAHSYQQSLSLDANVHGEGFGAKFRLSLGFKSVREKTTNNRHTYISSVAKCVSYVARITNPTAKLSTTFAEAVANLPTNDNCHNAYMEFIREFGTHYVKWMAMGAKVVMMSEFNQSGWATLETEALDTEAAASATFWGTFAGTSMSAGFNRRLADKFELYRRRVKYSTLGSRPSSDGKWETWAQSSKEWPYPIAYDLRPLTELFTSTYFPGIKPELMRIKRSKLDETFSTYCQHLPGCVVPGPDPPVVKMKAAVSDIIDIQLVPCPVGYSLVSCGLANVSWSTAREHYRNSIPVSPTSCQCYDGYGARCIAWCSTAVQGFSIQQSREWQTNDINVYCPAGSKVTGCTVESNGKTLPDKWRSHYPIADGSGCTCHDLSSAKCYATCATNIINYEIRTQYGMNAVTVECSPGNIVLGCGMMTYKRKEADYESWREYHVASVNTCRCYDWYGATCYAICGRFA